MDSGDDCADAFDAAGKPKKAVKKIEQKVKFKNFVFIFSSFCYFEKPVVNLFQISSSENLYSTFFAHWLEP